MNCSFCSRTFPEYLRYSSNMDEICQCCIFRKQPTTEPAKTQESERTVGWSQRRLTCSVATELTDYLKRVLQRVQDVSERTQHRLFRDRIPRFPAIAIPEADHINLVLFDKTQPVSGVQGIVRSGVGAWRQHNVQVRIRVVGREVDDSFQMQGLQERIVQLMRSSRAIQPRLDHAKIGWRQQRGHA
jgi:hypothetical protein